jgi:competence protein ComEA
VSRSDRILLAAAAGALILAAAAASVLLLPPTAASDPGEAFVVESQVALPSGLPAGGGDAPIVVDVEGGVVEPGVRELPPGSRVADAIAAAGGYGPDADLAAAAASINLAEGLADGQQVIVPRVGDNVVAAGSTPTAATGTTTTGGLVNLNTATPEELEALPGIGAVTVQKIVAARQEQPFASLEDAVERGVIHNGQLEDIQGLATAG